MKVNCDYEVERYEVYAVKRNEDGIPVSRVYVAHTEEEFVSIVKGCQREKGFIIQPRKILRLVDFQEVE